MTLAAIANPLLSISSFSVPGPAPSESFPYQDRLTQDYTLYWNFNTTHITFEMVVRTNGNFLSYIESCHSISILNFVFFNIIIIIVIISDIVIIIIIIKRIKMAITIIIIQS